MRTMIPVVRAFVDAVNAHDTERIHALSAERIVFIEAGSRIAGRDALRDAWREYFACCSDFRIEISEYLADGGHVAVFGHACGTYRDGTVPGRRWRLPAAWRMEVAAGKVSVWQVYADPAIPCDTAQAARRSHVQTLCTPLAETQPVGVPGMTAYSPSGAGTDSAPKSLSVPNSVSEFVSGHVSGPVPELVSDSVSGADLDPDPDSDPNQTPNPDLVSGNGDDAPELLTARLRLRAFAEEDAEAVFACCRNPELGDNAGWKPHESVEESRRVIRDVFLHQPGVWAVELRETGRLIGSIGLIADPKREYAEVLMLGYWLDKPFWGRGLMTEAARAVIRHGFDALGAPLISVCCYAANGRSKRLIERLGFRAEGMLHAAVKDHRGEVLDVLSYYLSREDFEQA